MAVLTPFFASSAGLLAGWVASVVPGLHLDPAQIVTFMTAVALAALTAAWKWLQGWQQHEQRVAQGKAVPAAGQQAMRTKARGAKKAAKTAKKAAEADAAAKAAEAAKKVP